MNGIKCISSCTKSGISCRIFYERLKLWSGGSTYILRGASNTLYNYPINRSSHTAVNAVVSRVIQNDNEQTGQVEKARKKVDISKGPGLSEFIALNNIMPHSVAAEQIPYLSKIDGNNRKVFFDIYGCQMNVNDTEVIWAILKSNGYRRTLKVEEADIVLVVTCAIRESAEVKIWERLNFLRNLRRKLGYSGLVKIGLLGCMAERLKHKLIEKDKLVDVVAGPDSYKDLPRLLAITDSNEAAINVTLSFDETYADIVPVRLNQDSVSAYVTITRGCDNMCTYCIVPFTRGRERSRPITSILDEIRHLSEEGVKEVTLLGQNVNSYRDTSESRFYTGDRKETNLAKGFKTVYKRKTGGLRFSDLLAEVSLVDPEMRIRFTSPHPKDFPDEVLQLIAERPNICRQLHLPAQSGNTVVLERMRRGYSREAYLDLVQRVRTLIPNVSLSSDFIAGFCGETDEEFEDTLSLIESVRYNMAFLFAYSMREKTTAHRRYKDDVDKSVKLKRLERMINLFRSKAVEVNRAQIGQRQLILVEKIGRKSDESFQGRNDGNTRVVVPNKAIRESKDSAEMRVIKPGDYVVAEIINSNSQVLTGVPLYHSSISQFEKEEASKSRG